MWTITETSLFPNLYSCFVFWVFTVEKNHYLMYCILCIATYFLTDIQFSCYTWKICSLFTHFCVVINSCAWSSCQCFIGAGVGFPAWTYTDDRCVVCNCATRTQQHAHNKNDHSYCNINDLIRLEVREIDTSMNYDSKQQQKRNSSSPCNKK